MKNFKKVALIATCTAMLGGAMMTTANAANWLMLQGTERDGAAPRAKVWGFIQPTYLSTKDTKLPVGAFAGQNSQFNVHQPNLASSSTFQIQRARVGVRGTALPLDSNVNYFILAEYGNNGITAVGGGGGSVKLSDATVTLNHIKGMRVRVGQMKIPMSEEVYQGIMTFNYINFTNMANQQLIERPFWTDGTTACQPGTSHANYLRFCNGEADTQFRGSAVAVRDTGIQLFDTFKSGGGWEHSYALLYGNGGVGKDNRDGEFDTTVYWSSEKVFGGKGPWRDHMKFFAWNTSGKRTLYDSATLDAGGSLESAEKLYDRNLSGIGFIYQKDKFRFWTEFTQADGMIFTGSTGGAVPGAVSNAGTDVAQFTMSPTGESDGGYVDFGYKITPKIELDVRYDWYNRVTNLAAGAERKYETTTLGFQYKFNKKTKFMVNYEIREFNSPNTPSAGAPLPGSGPNRIAASMEDKISAQVFLLF